MKTPLLIPLAGSNELARRLAASTGSEIGEVEWRQFPDGETYFRCDTEISGRNVILFASLDHPDAKFLPLIFAAETARELGAKSVGLVSPYLAYMRQDRRFQPGEAITSTTFAGMLSAHFDWMATVDPHLHRRTSLGEIYSIPTRVVHAEPLISAWVSENIQRPLLIGPDEESEQWVQSIAREAGTPHIVLKKIRRGDREVEVSVPEIERWQDFQPVLIDDIVSTGQTMIATTGHLIQAGLKPPICIGVHAIFAGSAYCDILAAGAARVLTTDTIEHESNAIEVTDPLAEAVLQLLKQTGSYD